MPVHDSGLSVRSSSVGTVIVKFSLDGLTGSARGDGANCTHSPQRALESELVVQPPVDSWDPLRLAQARDAADFARRHMTDFKYGRVSMHAIMGYIASELTCRPASPGEH